MQGVNSVRISELSRVTDVPVATIKYYLRERLLPEGRRTAATQAQYDETHVARLRLVRALISVGGLSVASTKAVLDQLADPPSSTHELLGVAQHLIEAAGDETIDLEPARELVAELGWRIEGADPGPLRRLAKALAGLEAAGFALPPGRLLDYARTMGALAEREVDDVPTDTPESAVRHVILGVVLVEPLLLALRRLAQIDASARRFEND